MHCYSPLNYFSELSDFSLESQFTMLSGVFSCVRVFENIPTFKWNLHSLFKLQRKTFELNSILVYLFKCSNWNETKIRSNFLIKIVTCQTSSNKIFVELTKSESIFYFQKLYLFYNSVRILIKWKSLFLKRFPFQNYFLLQMNCQRRHYFMHSLKGDDVERKLFLAS
jgi:hypothetical protein